MATCKWRQRMQLRIGVIFALAVALTLSAPASAEMSGEVVKIGVLSDMSGLYADIGGAGSVEAARMAIADFGGSVNGKKIELVSADHQNKPDVGSAIATQWFGNDGVDAIVDVPTSSVALAVQEVARNKNRSEERRVGKEWRSRWTACECIRKEETSEKLVEERL